MDGRTTTAAAQADRRRETDSWPVQCGARANPDVAGPVCVCGRPLHPPASSCSCYHCCCCFSLPAPTPCLCRHPCLPLSLPRSLPCPKQRKRKHRLHSAPPLLAPPLLAPPAKSRRRVGVLARCFVEHCRSHRRDVRDGRSAARRRVCGLVPVHGRACTPVLVAHVRVPHHAGHVHHGKPVRNGHELEVHELEERPHAPVGD